jgi:signal peptidase I
MFQIKKYINLSLILLLAIFIVRNFVVDQYLIPTDSMTPTLRVGSRVWINKSVFGYNLFGQHLGGYDLPDRGDIVAFFMPADVAKTKFIKRCTGIPHDKMILHNGLFLVGANEGFSIPAAGDTVQLDDKNLWFYQPLINQYEQEKVAILGQMVYINGKPAVNYVFKQNYFFVAGDNPTASHDSRYWGLLPESHLIGRLF